MTNSRELAEQAFALLQDALEESEAQRSELEARLLTRPPPESNGDQQLRQLAEQLSQVEQERAQWHKTASQLHDVVSNERAKNKRLMERLDAAEAGSDKTLRKEVNYWRQRADEFAAAKQQFQQRIFALRSELTSAQERYAALEREAGSQQTEDRLQSVIVEREQHISELAAAFEASKLRCVELEQRLAVQASEQARHDDARCELEAAHAAAEQARTELQGKLAGLHAEREELEQSMASLERDAAETRTRHDSTEQAKAAAERQVAELHAARETMQHELEALQRRLDELETSVDTGRRSVDALERELSEARAGDAAKQQEIESLGRELADARSNDAVKQQTIDSLERELSEARADVATRHETIDSLEKHLAAARAGGDANESVIESLRKQLVEARGLDNERRNAVEELQDELSELRSREEQQVRELAALRQQIGDLQAHRASNEDEIATLRELLAESQELLDTSRGQVSGLEQELLEERGRADGLDESVGEQRREIIRLTERFEEAQERYEDAKWQLGKAKHFQRLVRRRKKLIANLIANIRAKQKATNALKAGLDSLRRYKAHADQRQQELLRRIETLEQSLSEARERLGKGQNTKRAADQAPPAPDETMRLRTQLAAQTEVIRSLESDLKRMRLAESDMRSKTLEVERLSDDIATKNTFIGSLQKDIEEHQRVLTQLRKREIELRELGEKLDERDQRIVALTSENEALRSARPSAGGSVDRDRITELEKQVGHLSQQLRQNLGTIATLNQDVERWKRKYEFLSAEPPYGVDSAAGK